MSNSTAKKRRTWPWVVLAAVIVVLLIVWQQGSASLSGYETATVQRRDLATYYTFSGTLTPITDKMQTSKEAMKVKELYAAEGDVATSGQMLLRGSSGTRVYAAHEGTVEALLPEVDDAVPSGQVE